jgi:hypothetical protein
MNIGKGIEDGNRRGEGQKRRRTEEEKDRRGEYKQKRKSIV